MVRINDPRDGEGYRVRNGIESDVTTVATNDQVRQTALPRNDFPPIEVKSLDQLPPVYDSLRRYMKARDQE